MATRTDWIVAAGEAAPWYAGAVSDRPNILVLMTDQQRADAMSCAGNPILRTPAMDAIAASGVRFTDACASTPL